MGLDGVEILLELEKRFNIEISDPDAERLITIDDICQYVKEKNKAKNKEKNGNCCWSRESFFRLRKAFMKVLKCPKERIKPSTELDYIIPLEERPLFIERLEIESGLKFPDLEWNQSEIRYDIWIGAVSAFVFFIALHLLFLKEVSCMGLLVTFIVSVSIIYPAFKFLGGSILPKPTLFNSRHSTLRDMIHKIVRINAKSFDRGTTNKAEILRIVKEILIVQTGATEEQLELETNLVEDLGVGC